MAYTLGQIFINEYPQEAAEWCNDSGKYYIDEISAQNGNRRFQIKEIVIPEQTAEEKQAEFNKAFFNTSLGYVRRRVTMKDGDTKDFLTDILPMLSAGVPILTYDTDLNQSKVSVTDEFITECKQQLFKDFYGE